MDVELFDSLEGELLLLDEDADGVPHEPLGDLQHVDGHGGREQDDLAVGGHLPEDIVDLVLESSRQHLVGFVQHKHPDVAGVWGEGGERGGRGEEGGERREGGGRREGGRRGREGGEERGGGRGRREDGDHPNQRRTLLNLPRAFLWIISNTLPGVPTTICCPISSLAMSALTFVPPIQAWHCASM